MAASGGTAYMGNGMPGSPSTAPAASSALPGSPLMGLGGGLAAIHITPAQ